MKSNNLVDIFGRRTAFSIIIPLADTLFDFADGLKA
jgi:hypothetical protein